MKREKIIELYSKAQDEAPGGQLIEYFARLIEQETLALAANKVDSIGHYWSGKAARACFEVSEEIRNLKDSHE